MYVGSMPLYTRTTHWTYCDFSMWLKDDIHIVRIYPDDEFMSVASVEVKKKEDNDNILV